MIKNGASGTSVFISILFFLKPSNFLEKIIIKILVNAPTQNPKIRENSPADNPKNQPIPKINLPSPNPINRPLENAQSKTKGKASIGPDNKSTQDGQTNMGPIGKKFIKREIREIIIKG